MKRVAFGFLACCILGAGAWMLIVRARHDSQARSTLNHFREVQIALLNYRDVYSCLPALQVIDRNGDAVKSWRQTILLYIEDASHCFTGIPRFSELPWNDPELMADDEKDPTFAAPFISAVPQSGRERFEAAVCALTGPGTAFDLLQLPPTGAPQKTVKLNEVPNDTIIIVEVNHSGIYYRQPGDLDIRTMPREINPSNGVGISSPLADRFHIGFLDGEVWALSLKTPFETLEKLFTIEGAKANDRDELLAPYRVK